MSAVIRAAAALAAALALAAPAPQAEAARSQAPAARALAEKITRAATTPARERALRNAMRALGIGVYDARGRAVLRGAERGPKSLYLYTFELRGIAGALARKRRAPLSEVRADLASAGIPLAAGAEGEAALAAAIAEGIRQAQRHPRDHASLGPLLIRELGLRARPASDIGRLGPKAKLDALQRFLLVAELAGAAHRRASSRASLRSGPVAFAAKLPPKGTPPCTYRSDPATNTRWKFGRWIADKVIGESPLSDAVEKVATPLTNLWHATVLGMLMDFRPAKGGQVHDTAYGPSGHSGHGDPYLAGQPLVFRVMAELLEDVSPTKVRCGKLVGLTFPNGGKRGPVKGIPVDWDPALASGDLDRLLAHGAVVKKDDETDEKGIAELVIKPYDEVMPSVGATVTDLGVVQPGARLVGPFGNDWAEGWELLAPRLATLRWAVQFHEQYVFDVGLSGRQDTSWSSSMSGPWAHACDVNWDWAGTQSIRFTSPAPARVVFFVPPGAQNPDEFRIGMFENPYIPYVTLPLTATLERQRSGSSSGNPDCQAGGDGGGEPPPSPDCGTRQITMEGELEYRPSDADEPLGVNGRRAEEDPYKACSGGGAFERSLLGAAAGPLASADIRDLSTQRFVLHGNAEYRRDETTPMGAKSSEQHEHTTIAWDLSLTRRGTAP